MGENLLEHVESLQEEATETLTEFEYNLCSHPDYNRDERLYVNIPPPDRETGRAEELVENSMKEAVQLYGRLETLKEELNGNYPENENILKIIEAETTKLVVQATKILEDSDYKEWAFSKIFPHSYHLNPTGINYTPKREERNEQEQLPQSHLQPDQ